MFKRYYLSKIIERAENLRKAFQRFAKDTISERNLDSYFYAFLDSFKHKQPSNTIKKVIKKANNRCDLSNNNINMNTKVLERYILKTTPKESFIRNIFNYFNNEPYNIVNLSLNEEIQILKKYAIKIAPVKILFNTLTYSYIKRNLDSLVINLERDLKSIENEFLDFNGAISKLEEIYLLSKTLLNKTRDLGPRKDKKKKKEMISKAFTMILFYPILIFVNSYSKKSQFQIFSHDISLLFVIKSLKFLERQKIEIERP